jgi:hypothetical protein
MQLAGITSITISARLTHHTHIQELVGEAYHFRERMELKLSYFEVDVDLRLGLFRLL